MLTEKSGSTLTIRPTPPLPPRASAKLAALRREAEESAALGSVAESFPQTWIAQRKENTMSARNAAQAESLDRRIASVFAEDVAPGVIETLIREAGEAASASARVFEQARKRALDPRLSADQVSAARAESDDAAFRRDRLEEAVPRLGERLAELKHQAEQARRRVAYDEAAVERDALAAELAEFYPPFVEKLVELAARIVASDTKLGWVNRNSLPDGMQQLLSAELVARELPAFFAAGVHVLRITEQLRLPSFRHSPHEPLAWPRAQR